MPITENEQLNRTISREEMRAILHGLLSPHSDTRLKAQADLNAVGPAAVDQLLAEAELQTKRWMKRKRRYKWIAGTYVGIAVPGIATCIGLAFYYYNHGFPSAVGGLIGGGVGGLGGGLGGAMLGGCSVLLVPPRELAVITNALLSFDDPKVVGALVAGLSVPDGRLRMAAQDKLLTLLPQATADDLAEVTADQRQQLRKLLSLNPENDSQLIISVLQAFERMGDTLALPEAKKLAATRFTSTKAENHPLAAAKVDAVRAAAEQCVNTLQGLLGQGSDILLRASKNPTPESNELLRPAGFSAKGNDHLLLRPTGDSSIGVSSFEADTEETHLTARAN